MADARACAAPSWVYPFVLSALYEVTTCAVSPLTREYLTALLAALRDLPLHVLSWQQAQQAVQLAWRADVALTGQAVLRRQAAMVREALDDAFAAACADACVLQDERREEGEIEVRRGGILALCVATV